MKRIILLLVLAFLLSPLTKAQEIKDITTYYLIRHAEKDRTDPQNRDPFLTDKGLLRASNWGVVFDNIDLDAVYSSNYNRTRQTALPTANGKKLTLQLYDPKNIDIKLFKKETLGKSVLIVGHSNSTPRFVNLLIGKGKYHHIDDRENGNLFIVTFIDNKVSDMVLKIN